MTEELHEERLDQLHLRLANSNTIDEVVRDVEYSTDTTNGQLDFLLTVGEEKIYLEYKCTAGYSQRRCAKKQIRRAVKQGVVDYGIYVAGPMNRLRVERMYR